jgi:hypothetical protein
MSALTTRLALYKPGGGLSGTNLPDEVADVDKINGNMDLIDAAIGFSVQTSVTRPPTPYDGQGIFETDTRNFMVYSSAVARWLPANSEPNAASAAIRDALYPAPVDGDRVFRTDWDVAQRYDGAAWRTMGAGLVPIIPTGPAATGVTFGPSGVITLAGATNPVFSGVFSAEFDEVICRYNITARSVAGSLNLQMCLAGNPAAGATDYAGSYFVSNGAANASAAISSTTMQITNGGVTRSYGEINIWNAFIATPTELGGRGHSFGSAVQSAELFGCTHALSTSYDGFRLLASAGGTMTGTVKFFGVVK